MRSPKLSFSQKVIIKNLLKITIVIFVFLIIEFLSFKQTFIDIKTGKLSNPEIIKTGIIFFLGVIMGVGLYYFSEKLISFLNNTIRQLKNALKGNLGEKKTFSRLQELLGQQYKIYRNFRIPNTKFDNDAIIVGPKGIISLEIKNIGGNFDFIGEETYKHDLHYGNECLCKLNEYKSPTKEVLRHCKAFEIWLSGKGYKDIVLKRAVVLVGNNAKIIKMDDPQVYIVSDLDGLFKFIERSYNDPRFTKEFCEKLDQLLRI